MRMPLLLRTAAERRTLRRISMMLLYHANALVLNDMLEFVATSWGMSVLALRELLKPSRSWQKGINRVVVWSFENMYSEAQCYE
ncbi:MAG: hypothetical protein SGPRY_002065 [Prymnesium sp.]